MLNPVSIIVVFSLVWWLVFFISLPIGIRRVETPEPGHDPGAPANPNIRTKVFWTTVISLLLTAVIVTILNLGFFDWVVETTP